MILMILGASNPQINAIKYANNKGILTLVSDYNENPPGKQYANFHEKASTFDDIKTLEIAKRYKINGIMTTGTDQPVLTVAKIANKLNLPSFLTIDTAYKVTNKKAMKQTFSMNNIPTVDYQIIKQDFKDSQLDGLRFPVVVKPLDSQGQRGIFILNTIKEIRTHFNKVLEYSREKEILVETYYPSDEITISGWVNNKNVKILTITDRLRFKEKDKIGICLAHEFPSKYMNLLSELEGLTNNIVDAFNIYNGPIYFQLLIGNKGIKVNEIACRIGGAYEDIIIPFLTKVDILEMVIEFSLYNKISDKSIEILKDYNIRDNNKYSSVQLFFLREGIISYMTPKDEITSLKGLYSIGYNYKVKDKIVKIENATTRAGYAVITGNTKEDLINNVSSFYNKVQILDENKQNMIIHT